ncbi:DUF3800 domain-containing protein [Patescibacteria group bacterium]|nr:DUF3800 domain-containing protein [Patescibacteria group bacterium]
MLVFIDDSGDPGFKLDKGSTKFFVISARNFFEQLILFVLKSEV